MVPVCYLGSFGSHVGAILESLLMDLGIMFRVFCNGFGGEAESYVLYI